MQSEGQVLESHDRDRKAVVRKSVYAKPWHDTSVSVLGQRQRDPSPPCKGARPDRRCTRRSAAQPRSQLSDGAARGCSKAVLITEH